MNWFTSVAVAENGALSWAPRGGAGRFVTLRFEMDVLVAISATPHPLDPALAWSPKPVDLDILRFDPPGPADAVRNSCEQNGRGFTLTERLYL